MAGDEAGLHALAGALGGMMALTATFPLMTVSTRQAVLSCKSKSGAAAPAGQRQVRPGFAEVAALVRDEGWAALYGGIKPALLGTAASQGIYFYFYQRLRHALVSAKGRKSQDLSALESLYTSMCAGAINVCITQPIWTVVTRLQTKRRSKLAKGERVEDVGEDPSGGMLDEIAALYAEGGMPAFYRGLIPNLVMVSNPAVQFMLIEMLSARIRKAKGVREDAKLVLSPLETFSQGALAKVGATLITYPVQLIKSRMQAERRTKGAEGYASIPDAIRTIVATEGVGGLYKGMDTKMVQSVIAAALLFSTKEQTVNLVRTMAGAMSAVEADE